MNSQEVINLAKDCGLVFNRNHEILDFYQKLRSSIKKEFLNIIPEKMVAIKEE